MIEKFHDNDYDGVVIKIPSWFIELNKLQSSLEELKDKLSEAQLSTFHQDHISNLYELSKYKKKKEILESKNLAKLESVNKQKLRYEKILNGDIKILEWGRVSYVLPNLFILGDCKIDQNDILTDKLNVKATFLNLFNEKIKTTQDLIIFLTKVGHPMARNIDSDCIKMSSVNFSCSRHYPVLQVSCEFLYIQRDIKQKRNGGYTYRIEQIYKEDDKFFLMRGNEKILLEGIRHGMEILK
jgi:hypothetical protein